MPSSCVYLRPPPELMAFSSTSQLCPGAGVLLECYGLWSPAVVMQVTSPPNCNEDAPKGTVVMQQGGSFAKHLRQEGLVPQHNSMQALRHARSSMMVQLLDAMANSCMLILQPGPC